MECLSAFSVFFLISLYELRSKTFKYSLAAASLFSLRNFSSLTIMAILDSWSNFSFSILSLSTECLCSASFFFFSKAITQPKFKYSSLAVTASSRSSFFCARLIMAANASSERRCSRELKSLDDGWSRCRAESTVLPSCGG